MDKLSNQQWCTSLPKPICFIVGEIGRKGIEDALMVVVEPVDFLRQKHINEDRSLVDGTEGERLELEELAELRFLVGDNQQGVLCTGTTTAWEIDARFIATNGAGFHSIRN